MRSEEKTWPVVIEAVFAEDPFGAGETKRLGVPGVGLSPGAPDEALSAALLESLRESLLRDPEGVSMAARKREGRWDGVTPPKDALDAMGAAVRGGDIFCIRPDRAKALRYSGREPFIDMLLRTAEPLRWSPVGAWRYAEPDRFTPFRVQAQGIASGWVLKRSSGITGSPWDEMLTFHEESQILERFRVQVSIGGMRLEGAEEPEVADFFRTPGIGEAFDRCARRFVWERLARGERVRPRWKASPGLGLFFVG